MKILKTVLKNYYKNNPDHQLAGIINKPKPDGSDKMAFHFKAFADGHHVIRTTMTRSRPYTTLGNTRLYVLRRARGRELVKGLWRWDHIQQQPPQEIHDRTETSRMVANLTQGRKYLLMVEHGNNGGNLSCTCNVKPGT